jgi:hypothetical protein
MKIVGFDVGCVARKKMIGVKRRGVGSFVPKKSLSVPAGQTVLAVDSSQEKISVAQRLLLQEEEYWSRVRRLREVSDDS